MSFSEDKKKAKEDPLKEQWIQICDDDLLDEVPEMESVPIMASLSTDYSLQDKELYMENHEKDKQIPLEERYKVVVNITPKEEENPRVVDVKGILISSQVTKSICSLCTTFESLKVLRLINCNLKSESIFLLSSELEKTKIIYLYLDKNPILDQNYHVILKSNFVLQHLSLRMCRIDSLGAKNLGMALMYANPEHQRLRSLNLNGNLIDCEGAASIAQALRWNRTLVYLSMAGNRIGDKGAQAIADVFLPFQLTYEELVFRSQRIADRLKTVRKNMYEQSFQAAPKKKKKDGASASSAEVHQEKKNEVTETIAHFVQLIKTADDAAPLDMHPLFAEVEEYEDEYWNKGNDTLLSLNIAYNKISIDGLGYFLEVAKYQGNYLTQSRGLTKLIYEGNPYDEKDEQNVLILNSLKGFFSKTRTSNVSKTSRKSSTRNA